jgi:hypothetical protein
MSHCIQRCCSALVRRLYAAPLCSYMHPSPVIRQHRWSATAYNLRCCSATACIQRHCSSTPPSARSPTPTSNKSATTHNAANEYLGRPIERAESGAPRACANLVVPTGPPPQVASGLPGGRGGGDSFRVLTGRASFDIDACLIKILGCANQLLFLQQHRFGIWPLVSGSLVCRHFGWLLSICSKFSKYIFADSLDLGRGAAQASGNLLSPLVLR